MYSGYLSFYNVILTMKLYTTRHTLALAQILSLVREGDYAHPGEEEAILLTLDPLKKDPNRVVLDVGCGLGKPRTMLKSMAGAMLLVSTKAASVCNMRVKITLI